jgi:hypothetical protein
MLEAALISIIADKLIGKFAGRILEKGSLETVLGKLSGIGAFAKILPDGLLTP